MPDAAPLMNGADSATRRRDDARPYASRPPPRRFSDLEAERDALREMMKQAKAREMFF